MKNRELFETAFRGAAPDGETFTPYRVCPLGAHIDHQQGKITGFAIDKGIYCTWRRREDGGFAIVSRQFDTRAEFSLNDIPSIRVGDWADHLRGAVLSLGKRYELHTGIDALIDGELPIGGLSSSAAVIISFLNALCAAQGSESPTGVTGGIALGDRELITIAREAENSYVGVACGKLDQSCEVFCRAEHLLYMDMLDDSYENIAPPVDMPDYTLAVIFSGVERSLVGSRYNMRVDEAKSAAYALQAWAGVEYGKFDEAFLRNVPREIFEHYGEKLPGSWRRRAEHYYSESERVEAGVEAWRRGDLAAFGMLMNQSARSSMVSWETGSPELRYLCELMANTEGIYGGRFSGAGFKGSCIAIADPAYTESIADSLRRAYLREFPALEGKYELTFCGTADGVGTGR